MPASGSQYTRSKGGIMSGKFWRDIAASVQPIIEDELEQAGIDGVRKAQDIIEEGGTGNVWSGRFRDRDGTVRSEAGSSRMASGKMYDMLNYRIIHGKNVGLDVGWPNVWEAYFGAQASAGFEHAGYRHVNQFVKGLGLFAILKTYMTTRTQEAIDRAEERIFRGI